MGDIQTGHQTNWKQYGNSVVSRKKATNRRRVRKKHIKQLQKTFMVSSQIKIHVHEWTDERENKTTATNKIKFICHEWERRKTRFRNFIVTGSDDKNEL